jgi:histidyl-tRNA synthetase
MVVEAELIAAVSDVLERLGFNDFTIRLNHRRLIDAMMSASMIEKERRSDALISVDKLDKIGVDAVRKELSLQGIPGQSVETLLYRMTKRTFIDPNLNVHTFSQDRYQSNHELLGFLASSFKDLLSDKETTIASSEALGELTTIVDLVQNTSAADHIKIDQSLARGLSYYTGAIMETQVKDLAGSLGGGGRYDNLVGTFLGKDVPACGFSLGLERIIMVMSECDMFPPHLGSSPADVMITVWNEDSIGDSLALAAELRGNGLRVDLYPEADKLAKQFKYASSRGIPYVAIIGDDERARGEVAIKEMLSGDQRCVKRELVAEELRKVMDEHP